MTKNGDFDIELSVEKVPLRKMYDYPVMVGHGNICDSMRDIIWSGAMIYDKRVLVNDLATLYGYGIYNKYLELTNYPIKVGQKQDYFVFWEIR